MRKGRPGIGGVKGGTTLKSKVTKLAPYQPYNAQIHSLTKLHWDDLQNPNDVFLYAHEPNPEFMQPLKLEDVKAVISTIPKEFTGDLKGVILCPGSSKQARIVTRTFGIYSDSAKTIFLFPFPKDMSLNYVRKPKPSICHDYERHGAIWIQEGKRWRLRFDAVALRSFYLRDVLVHEIGHHVDNIASFKGSNYSEQERFAEWFACEFGLGSETRGMPETGKMLQQIIRERKGEGP